jgi:hypothetical protein
MKLPAALLAIVASLALAACGGSDDSGGGGISNEGNEELFTTAGFQEALSAVEEKAGSDAQMLQLQITSGGANFKLRDGEQATGFVYTGGEVVDEEVEVIGGGTLEGTDYPFSEIDAAAIDKIRHGVAEVSGVDDIEITVLTFEKAPIDGVLKWVINADGGGRTGLVFNANPDGSNVTSLTGDIAGAGDAGAGATDAGASGGAGAGNLPTDASSAQDIAQCIQDAGGDVAKIQACAQQ